MSQLFRPANTRKVLIAVSDMFNNVQIETKSGDIINIPIFISSAEKLIARITKGELQSGKTVKLATPAMGLEITSMDLDEERIMQPINKIFSGRKYVLQPVPYNYTIDLTVIADRNSTLFDIIESIIPYYQKARYYPLIDFKFSDGTEIQHDMAVELNALPLDIQSIDVDAEGEQMYKVTFSLMVKAWIYGYNPTLDPAYEDIKLYLSLQGSNTGNIPSGSSLYWQEIEDFNEINVYNDGEYVVYNNNIYRIDSTSTITIPGETGSDWTLIGNIDEFPSWLNNTIYNVSNIVLYPGRGLIEHIDINFEDLVRGDYERLLIDYNADGSITENIT